MKAQKSTLGYYDILPSSTSTYEEVLKDALKKGYKYIFRWINSDKNWTFFQTTCDKAIKAATELYLKERGSKLGMSLKEADKYYSEFVDVIEIKQELTDL